MSIDMSPQELAKLRAISNSETTTEEAEILRQQYISYVEQMEKLASQEKVARGRFNAEVFSKQIILRPRRVGKDYESYSVQADTSGRVILTASWQKKVVEQLVMDNLVAMEGVREDGTCYSEERQESSPNQRGDLRWAEEDLAEFRKHLYLRFADGSEIPYDQGEVQKGGDSKLLGLVKKIGISRIASWAKDMGMEADKETGEE